MSKVIKFLAELFKENGKWSLSKFLLVAWFGLLFAYGIKFLYVFGIRMATGETVQMSEPTFLVAVFMTLVGIVFANKTSLNLKAKQYIETKKQEEKDVDNTGNN